MFIQDTFYYLLIKKVREKTSRIKTLQKINNNNNNKNVAQGGNHKQGLTINFFWLIMLCFLIQSLQQRKRKICNKISFIKKNIRI